MFRRMSKDEVKAWKSTKNKIKALRRMKAQSEKDTPGGIPFYLVGKPSKKEVTPLYSDGRLIRDRHGVIRKYLDWQVRDLQSNATFNQPVHPNHHLKPFRSWMKENYA